MEAPYEVIVNFPEQLETILNSGQFNDIITKLTDLSTRLDVLIHFLSIIVYIIAGFFVWKVCAILYKLFAGWFLGGL